jgi:hypothetical protein
VQSIVLVDENDNITGRVVSGGAVRSDAPALITLVTMNFLAQGGDGYPFKANADNFRFLLTDGSLSAAQMETSDFTAAGVVPANILGEQAALSNYLQARYATPATAYDIADTTPALDTRIQSTAVRTDNVLAGPATFAAWLALNGYSSTGINNDSDLDGSTDLVEYFFNQNTNSGSDNGNLPVVTMESGEKFLTFTTNNTAAGVNGILQTSTDLGISDQWDTAVEGVDYQEVSSVVSGDETTTTIKLLGTAQSEFWRHRITSN